MAKMIMKKEKFLLIEDAIIISPIELSQVNLKLVKSKSKSQNQIYLKTVR